MGKRGFFGDRRGEGEGVIFPIIIFTVLNILFFLTFSLFVARSSSGAFIYEQGYAKEVALIIDNLKPGSEGVIDLKVGVDKAKELRNTKSASDQDVAGSIIRIDESANKVTASLGGKTGYSFKYFSSCKVELKAEGSLLRIKCKEAVVA